MNSILSFLAAAIRLATPIALATLACTISEKAGVINIGIEGIMTGGAFSAALYSSVRPEPFQRPSTGLFSLQNGHSSAFQAR